MTLQGWRTNREKISHSPQAAARPYVDTEFVWFSEEAWLISPRGFFTFGIQTNCCFLINRAPTTLLSVFSWIYFLLNPFSFSHPVYFQAVIFHAVPQGVSQRRKGWSEEDEGAGVVPRLEMACVRWQQSPYSLSTAARDKPAAPAEVRLGFHVTQGQGIIKEMAGSPWQQQLEEAHEDGSQTPH